MCGSNLSVKGGMVTVVKNYLNFDWKIANITYIPTHISNKILIIPFFLFQCIKIIIFVIIHKPQIAHLHTAERGSFYRKAFLVILLKKMGVKTIMHHHAAEFDIFYSNLSSILKKIINKVLSSVDINIVLSKKLIPMIKLKAPNANVAYLYNAVNTYDKNLYNPKAKNIMFLGRLGKRKGTYDFLDAIKLLDKIIDKDIKIFLCGDGDVEGVSSYIQKIKIQNRIEYIGWIDDNKKQEFFKKTMINVLPSYNEGLPMTILETMAYGIPNISTNIASIPEVIHDGLNGFLVSPGDINSLAHKLLVLINNNELKTKFSESSYKLILKQFSLDSNIKKLEEIYVQLIS